MNLHFAADDSRLHAGVGLQVLDLGQHVVLRKQPQSLFFTGAGMVAHDAVLYLGGVPHPFLHGWQAMGLLRMQQRLHHAAISVAADNDQWHFQHQHGVLDSGRDSAYELTIMRDEISRILLEERSPGPVCVMRLGTTRESAQLMNSAKGCCPRLRDSNRARRAGYTSV